MLLKMVIVYIVIFVIGMLIAGLFSCWKDYAKKHNLSQEDEENGITIMVFIFITILTLLDIFVG